MRRILGWGILYLLAAQLVWASTDPKDLQVVRAYFPSLESLRELGQWKAPWQVRKDQGYVILEVTEAELARLQAAGFQIEVDAKRTADLRMPRPSRGEQPQAIPGFTCYRTVEETYAAAQQIVADHPNLATWIDIGNSWEKTQNAAQGYDMQVLRLTNSAIPGTKPKTFLLSAIHAREYTTAELNTRFAEFLVSSYGIDPDVTWILDHQEVHLLLQANPDGRKKAESGSSWRKNTNGNYCGTTSNSRGADLNRNYDFEWNCCNGSSGSACVDTYRGPSAGSEPETQAVQNYVLSLFPDQRGPNMNDAAPSNATGVFIDIHSSGELVLWPWGFTQSGTAPNGTALQTLGRKFAWFNGHDPEQSSELYVTDGATDDFAYGRLGVAAFTFELGTQFFETCSTFENSVLPGNLQALLYAVKVSRTPYQTPAGPDTLSVQVSPMAVAPGEAIGLSATANDLRFNNGNGTEPTQNIAAAEVYVDTPPWIGGALAVALTATDGTFNATTEGLTGTLDTTGWANGRHQLFVRARDAAGNWGAISSSFVYVLDPATAPKFEGTVLEAGTDLPLDAVVTATGGFQASSNPTDGDYLLRLIAGTYTLTASAPDHLSQSFSGLTIQDLQTVQRDFQLPRTCAALENNAESGAEGWTATAPWAITTEASHSPNSSWTDSPGGDYAASRNHSLTSPLLNLTDYQSVHLQFWQICDTEATYDFCRVEISTNGGTNWTEVAAYDGLSSTWQPVDLALDALNGQPNARIRFRFTSDNGIQEDGWHLDDIRVTGAGLQCFGGTPGPSPTPTLTPTRTVTRTPTLSATPTRSNTVTPTRTATFTRTPSPTGNPLSPTATRTHTSSPTRTATASPTPSVQATATPSPSGLPATPTPTSSPTSTASPSPSSPEATATSTQPSAPTETVTETPGIPTSPTLTATPSSTATGPTTPGPFSPTATPTGLPGQTVPAQPGSLAWLMVILLAGLTWRRSAGQRSSSRSK